MLPPEILAIVPILCRQVYDDGIREEIHVGVLHRKDHDLYCLFIPSGEETKVIDLINRLAPLKSEAGFEDQDWFLSEEQGLTTFNGEIEGLIVEAQEFL